MEEKMKKIKRKFKKRTRMIGIDIVVVLETLNHQDELSYNICCSTEQRKTINLSVL